MKDISTCQKCHGMIANGYDVSLREEYRYCINCGFRPKWSGKFPGGSLRNTLAMCRRCKQHPATNIQRAKEIIQAEHCQYCRVEYLAKRRAQKLVRREVVQV